MVQNKQKSHIAIIGSDKKLVYKADLRMNYEKRNDKIENKTDNR